MTDAELVSLAERYFAALDARDPDALAACLAPDCRLSIETHGAEYASRDAVRALFDERWQGEIHARHHDFTHTPAAGLGRIVSQFTATYTGAGAPAPKSNANVFTVKDGLITRIQVYMSGANTIRT